MSPSMDHDGDFDGFETRADAATLARVARLPMQRLATPADLDRIAFDQGLATVEIDAELLPAIAFKNAARSDEARVAAMMRSIRAKGYQPLTPVICRIGRKGKWVVVDGGHRLTALKRLYETDLRRRLVAWLRRGAARWPVLGRLAKWLAGPPTRVYAILFLGPRSLSAEKTAQ